MIDEKIQAELRAKYNPDGSRLRQHQLRMLEMLKYFDELCQKHGIRYWLSSGNCIGVARHGGFIPWDDDIDVEMLREDYLKLLNVFKETDDYVLQTWKNDLAYNAPFAKMRDKHSFLEEHGADKGYKYKGVFIDILCLEKSPRFLCVLFFIFRWRLLMPIYNKSENKFMGYLYRITKKLFFHSISVCRFLFGWMPKNKLRHTYGCHWYDKIRIESDIFPLQRAKFENIEVNVPNNIDAYLRKIYGDYMRLPDENKIQIPHITKLELY